MLFYLIFDPFYGIIFKYAFLLMKQGEKQNARVGGIIYGKQLYE